MNNSWKHFKLVMTHKKFVFRACRKAGIPFRGLMHDMSKFSVVEFSESVKYFTGVSSPIDEAKKDKGLSMAWLHHRGRNKHHWAYWVDNLTDGGIPTLMPYKYALEMACDFIGAGQAYMGESWSFDTPYDWFLAQEKDRSKIHPSIVAFLDCIFWTMKEQQSYEALDKSYTKSVYKSIVEENEHGVSVNYRRE